MFPGSLGDFSALRNNILCLTGEPHGTQSPASTYTDTFALSWDLEFFFPMLVSGSHLPKYLLSYYFLS